MVYGCTWNREEPETKGAKTNVERSGVGSQRAKRKDSLPYTQQERGYREGNICHPQEDADGIGFRSCDCHDGMVMRLFPLIDNQPKCS